MLRSNVSALYSETPLALKTFGLRKMYLFGSRKNSKLFFGRQGHSHPIAVQSARKANGKRVGHVSK